MPKPSQRWDVVATRLTVLAIILGSFAAIVVIGTSIAGAIAGDHSVALHQTVSLEKISSLPPNVLRTQEVGVSLELHDVTTHQILLATVRDLLPIVLGLPILWFLLGIV